MASRYTQAQEYWGHLIEQDKTPTPLLEQLLLGLANYIADKVTSWRVRCLTPAKLAEYYRLVGGNYDDLFLKSKNESLAFMYRSLGCFHTLQPGSNPYVAPALPALTPEGFVRWQFIQILLDPGAHVPLLQEAVKRFEIRRPDGREPFPHLLPKEALPRKTDKDVLKWYNGALETLAPPTPRTTFRTSSPSPKRSVEVQSITDSSADDSSFVDASDYFPAHRDGIPRASHRVIPPSPDVDSYASRCGSRTGAEHDRKRRGSTDQRRISDEPWLSDGPTPTAPAPPSRPRPNHLARSHTTRAHRTQSSYDSDGGHISASAARERAQQFDRSSRSGERLAPFLDPHGRRHSASNLHDRRHADLRYELPQSQTLSPPFYARAGPSDMPSEMSLPRPQSAVRFDTPDYAPRQSRTVSRPVRSASTRYSSSSSSSSGSEGEEGPVGHVRGSSRGRDAAQRCSRRGERR